MIHAIPNISSYTLYFLSEGPRIRDQKQITGEQIVKELQESGITPNKPTPYFYAVPGKVYVCLNTEAQIRNSGCSTLTLPRRVLEPILVDKCTQSFAKYLSDKQLAVETSCSIRMFEKTKDYLLCEIWEGEVELSGYLFKLDQPLPKQPPKNIIEVIFEGIGKGSPPNSSLTSPNPPRTIYS